MDGMLYHLDEKLRDFLFFQASINLNYPWKLAKAVFVQAGPARLLPPPLPPALLSDYFLRRV